MRVDVESPLYLSIYLCFNRFIRIKGSQGKGFGRNGPETVATEAFQGGQCLTQPARKCEDAPVPHHGALAFSVQIHQEALHALLAASGRAIANNPPAPVLGAVLLDASNGALRATGYDLRVGIKAAFGGLVGADGEVLAPYRLLSELVAKLPPVEVELKAAVDGSTLALHCGGSEYAIPLDADLDPADYPALPDATSEGARFIVPTADLLAATRRVSASVPRAEQGVRHPELHGVGIKWAGGVLRLTGGDGSQFLVSSLAAEARPDSVLDIVLPIEAVRDLTVLAGGIEEAELWVADGRLHVAAGAIRFCANILVNPYPPVERILPSEYTYSWAVERDLLKAAVERLAVFSSIGAEAVRVELAESSMTLSLSGVAGGSEVVPVAEGPAEPLNIAFLTRRLLDVVRSTSGKMITMEAIDSAKVTYWHGENEADQAFLMPCAAREA
jgi:DNA polymerase III subunit beta